MGIFDFFKGSSSNIELVPDRIWLTRQAKLDGLAGDLAKSLAAPDSPHAVVLVAHFDEYLEPLEQLVQSGGFDAQRVTVTLADKLSELVPKLLALHDTARVDVMAVERHLLASHDEVLEEFARKLACRCRVTFYESLDDPLMAVFAGDWVKSALERLGMTESEPIESHMVTRRIKQAQKKIAGLVVSDTPARSSEEWLKLNRAIQ